MKGDFTRSTFDPRKHYSSVRMQQGRVQLDADWNEQMDILGHRVETETVDVIGRCGFPKHAPGFEITELPGDLRIGAGRGYVDGILCELEAEVTFKTQPHLPDAADLLEGAGAYFAYLDVWRRHVTVVEDGAIREVALGGPDTATRLQTVWQVKLVKVGGTVGDLTCESEPDEWKRAIAPPTGKLRARARPVDDPDNPCIVPASAGYTRLENQLYRVEVHKGGTLSSPPAANGPTFKWSRDNGSIATEWLGQDSPGGNKLTVQSTGRDSVLRFEDEGWLELTDDAHELLGQPGEMRQANRVEGDVIEIHPGDPLTIGAFQPIRKARRWDSAGDLPIQQAAANDGYLALEGGIEVRFELGEYRTGDYWLIPARAFIGESSGKIEWPHDGATPLALPPQGVDHHYCKLALVKIGAGGSTEVLSDCRDVFPPLTEITGCCCCTVEVGDGKQSHGDFDSLAEAVEALSKSKWKPGGVWIPAVICLLPGTHRLRDRVTIGRDRITIRGCGRLARVVGPSGASGGTAFRFDGSHGALEEVYLTSTGGAAAVIWTGHDGCLDRCEIETAGGAAIVAHRSFRMRVLGCRLGAATLDTAVGGSSGLIELNGTWGAQVIGNQVGPGPEHGILLSGGIHDLLIAGNEIRKIHGCGITTADPSGDIGGDISFEQIDIDKVSLRYMISFVLQRIDELRIEHNTIAGCVGPHRLRPDQEPEVPDGGIVLRRLSHVQISDNRIEDNGTELEVNSPVAGIYVQDCKGLIVRDNVIIDNGPPPDGKRIPGLQGGILAEDLSVVVELVDLLDGAQQRLVPLQPDGWPAAAVHGNLVEAPRGLALLLAGMGPMQVTGNSLTSRDVLFELGDKSPAVYDLFGVVVIYNLGLPAYALAQLLGGFLLTVAPAADTLTDKLDLLTVGGKVDFSNNQVFLNQIRGEVEAAIAAVGILTLDDLALHDNQTECTQLVDFLVFDTWAIAATLRATGNGFTESLFTTAISLWAVAFLMCTCTSNQGTHCIIAECLDSTKLRDDNNLALACNERFAGIRLFPQ